MLNRIIAFSLQNRAMVLALSVLLLGYGGYTATRMPIDVLPDLNRPTVTILAEAHAMVPQDVELRVVLPIEQALNGATGITRVRSQSGLGLGVIYAEFDWNTEIFRNRQIVQERLQLAMSKLPPEVNVELAPVSSIMGQVQMIGVQSRSGATPVGEIRTLADTGIRPRLLSIPGVAQVIVVGGAPLQLQVTADADKLRAHGVSLEELAEALRNTNLNGSGGILDVGAKGPVITVTGRALETAPFASAVVRSGGARPVRVEDVARVEFGPAMVRVGDAGINGKPGVAIVIAKQPGVDTVTLTTRVNAELADLQRGLPRDIVVLDDVFQQAQFIHRAIDNVLLAVRDGTVLVIVILVLFLMNLRTTVITLTAIPLSVAATAIIFAAFGLSINTMTLGGLAVAVGALVDDAIVDVENVFRRLRENAALPSPRNTLWVVFKASSEVRKPILIGTLLVVVVYLPLFYMTGLEGRLFTPIGLAYIVSVMASLAVSLTVTPVLCHLLLGRSVTKDHARDGWLVTRLKAAAGACIRVSVAHAAAILGALGAAVCCALLLLYTRGSEFLPAFNEGSAQVNLNLPPDAGIKVSSAYGERLEKVLVSVPGVKHVGRRTGRAEGDEHAMGVNITEAVVTFDPQADRSREAIVDEIRERLESEFPGVPTETEQPLAHLLSHLLSGVNAQVAVKIYGPDLDILRRTSEEVEAALRPIPGVKDLYTQPLVLIDEVVAEPKREALARYGLTVKDVADTFELAGGAEAVSRIDAGQIAYPVVVRLEERDRRDLESLRSLPVRTPAGQTLRAQNVADVRMSKTPNMIQRENVSRRAVVQHNVGGRPLSEVVSDVERALEPIRLKLAATPGYSIRVSGQFEAQAEAERLIVLLSFVALAAMFLLLFLHFGSVNLSVQVLLSIPMAFVGAAIYIVASRQTMSVATLVGLISLGGIAARNAILLLDHYLHLMREEKEPFSVEMIVRAGQERMVPVLMTALSSGIALIPLALAPDEPGREILYPVATVIIGGLISSTILDFLVTPGVFWLFGRRDAERIAAQPQHRDPAADAMAAEFSAPASAGAQDNQTGTNKELAHG